MTSSQVFGSLWIRFPIQNNRECRLYSKLYRVCESKHKKGIDNYRHCHATTSQQTAAFSPHDHRQRLHADPPHGSALILELALNIAHHVPLVQRAYPRTLSSVPFAKSLYIYCAAAA